MGRPESLLGPETEQAVAAIGETDLLVGIPSYNNADTIEHVVHAVSAGLAKYFPGRRAVLVNSDGGSADGTSDLVSRAVVDLETMFIGDRQDALHKIITPYHGLPGKGSALRTIFEIARRLNAKACAVVDSDLRSITPEWIGLLLQPIVEEGYEYVAPYYLRHKYDGTITNSIVYPLTRTLYGYRIRQPIGGEFGFAGRLAAHYADQQVWESEVARFGVDIWMTTEAIASGAKVCQSFLGAKIHNPKDPSADLSAMLVEVVGALFALMEAHEGVWWEAVGSDPVKLFGFQYEVGVEPVNVNVERMIASFDQGIRDLEPIWQQILAPETFAELFKVRREPAHEFRLPDDLWARIVYDAASAYHYHTLPREHLLRAMTPLYLGRTATFVLETQGLTSREAEHRVETLCQTFEQLKPYLMAKWRKQPVEQLEASPRHAEAASAPERSQS